MSHTRCSPRCWDAHFTDCSCACNGRNHGRGGPSVPTLPGLLPGMESVLLARAHASAVAVADSLSHRLRETRSIEAAAGFMEMRSPLFSHSPANPQSSLLGLLDLAREDWEIS